MALSMMQRIQAPVLNRRATITAPRHSVVVEATKAATKTSTNTNVIGKVAFVNLLAKKTGQTQKVSAEVLNTALNLIMTSVQSGKKVKIAGFGSFSPRSRKGHVGRNPQTGEPLEIGDSKSIGFTCSSTIKSIVNGRVEAGSTTREPKAVAAPAPKAPARPKTAAAKAPSKKAAATDSAPAKAGAAPKPAIANPKPTAAAPKAKAAPKQQAVTPKQQELKKD